jgi:hypothetical protein
LRLCDKIAFGSLPRIFGLASLLGCLDVEDSEFRVAMFVAQLSGVPIHGDSDVLRKPKTHGHFPKMHFAKGEVGCFSFQVQPGQEFEQVGAQSKDFAALRIDVSQALGESAHRAVTRGKRSVQPRFRGLLGEGTYPLV